MGDCFPRSGGHIQISDACKLRTGVSEYGMNYKQWPNPVHSPSFSPSYGADAGNGGGCGGGEGGSPWKQRYSFSKGPRFGIPPYCDCTPPPERSRFETTYQHDFFDMHHNNKCNWETPALPGVKPRIKKQLPKQYLCPFTTDTTYARAYDMPQSHFQPVCAQQVFQEGSCCGGNSSGDNGDGGIQICFKPPTRCRQAPRLRNLIKPGTDTSQCCKCPRKIPCCPCDDSSKLCDACCGCEYPCKLHQAATTPMRKYPIIMGTPRYVPNPRDPPRRPKLLCGGGTLECPLQNQYPTQAAIAQAKQDLLEKLEEERCKFPPECIESTYRSTYKTPPLEKQEHRTKKTLDKSRNSDSATGLPDYCYEDGGPPPDPRPMFDHMSTYEADFIYDYTPKLKYLGGESNCRPQIKPLCEKVICASEVIKERTEEKERWGENWECCPEP